MDKQALWGKTEEKVDQFRDALKMPIDKGIRETVIVLNVLGFTTSMSCEGHLDRGLPYPWVDIKFNEVEMELLDGRTTPDLLKMISLLEEFYEVRKPLQYARITISQRVASFRIQSIVGRSAERLKVTVPAFLETFYGNCVQEMNDFTEFLKQKFWNNTL